MTVGESIAEFRLHLEFKSPVRGDIVRKMPLLRSWTNPWSGSFYKDSAPTALWRSRASLTHNFRSWSNLGVRIDVLLRFLVRQCCFYVRNRLNYPCSLLFVGDR